MKAVLRVFTILLLCVGLIMVSVSCTNTVTFYTDKDKNIQHFYNVAPHSHIASISDGYSNPDEIYFVEILNGVFFYRVVSSAGNSLYYDVISPDKTITCESDYDWGNYILTFSGIESNVDNTANFVLDVENK